MNYGSPKTVLYSDTNLPVATNKLASNSASLAMTFADSAHLDAFDRLRVSNPVTLFDSKQIFDSGSLFWDDQQVSGSGTTSTYTQYKAATDLAVSANTVGWRIRQTKQRFNYQPAKSQLILATGILGTPTSGITRRIGYFDDNNGLYFASTGSAFGLAVRSSATNGSPVDNFISQSAFNLDKLDGTGASGVTLNLAKTNIFLKDFEWLGVGRVRMGVVVDGAIIYCHQFLNANSGSQVYMSTPNLPLRYEIKNDGTGPASTLTHICASVISEGGSENLGTVFSANNGSTAVNAASVGTEYAALGIRLKQGYLGATIYPEGFATLTSTTGDYLLWQLKINPTIAGSFTYTDITNSACQSATGATANTVTAGTGHLLASGYTSPGVPMNNLLPGALNLGSTIAGVSDQLVLTVKPVVGTSQNVFCALNWRELV